MVYGQPSDSARPRPSRLGRTDPNWNIPLEELAAKARMAEEAQQRASAISCPDAIDVVAIDVDAEDAKPKCRGNGLLRNGLLDLGADPSIFAPPGASDQPPSTTSMSRSNGRRVRCTPVY